MSASGRYLAILVSSHSIGMCRHDPFNHSAPEEGKQYNKWTKVIDCIVNGARYRRVWVSGSIQQSHPISCTASIDTTLLQEEAEKCYEIEKDLLLTSLFIALPGWHSFAAACSGKLKSDAARVVQCY